MAAQQSDAVESLRILVYSDPLSSEDKDVIRTYLTISLQLLYPRKQVVVELYCSSQSLALEERLNGIAQQFKYNSENDVQPYDWFLPLLFFTNGVAEEDSGPNYPWPVYSQNIAVAAQTIASHTLLTTIARSASSNKAFLKEFNEWIEKLGAVDRRYLLDLDAISIGDHSSIPTWSIICDNIAASISQQERQWDSSENDVSECLYTQSDEADLHIEGVSLGPLKPVAHTRKYFYHQSTEIQLDYWRKELDKRFVIHLQKDKNVQETPKAKRTQDPKIKITRPDRVTAESYRSPRKSKYSEAELNQENSPANVGGESSIASPHRTAPVGSSRLRDATGVAASPRVALKESSGVYNGAQTLNPLNRSNKRSRDASDEPGRSVGEGCVSPDSRSYASLRPNPLLAHAPADNEVGRYFVMPPNGDHPVWSKSYTTYKSHKERKKAGKLVIFKYTSKPKAGLRASAIGQQHRGSSTELDRSSVLGQEERNSSPNTSAEEDVREVDARSTQRAFAKGKNYISHGNPGQCVGNANGRVTIDKSQRQISDAALRPAITPSGNLSEFPRIDATEYANPFDLDSMADIPDWVFHPDTTLSDFMLDFEDDMDPRTFAKLTDTVNPAVLSSMTHEDVLEAHMPVMECYKAMFPWMFESQNPLAPAAVEGPLPPPELQLNGQPARMRRNSVPNPLQVWASPGQHQNPYPAARVGEVEPPRFSLAPALGTASAASVAVGSLLPPQQTHLPSPSYTGYLAYMADDLRTVSNTPEPGNNSAHISRAMTRTPPGTPGVHGLAKDNPRSPQPKGPTPHFMTVPESIRRDWLNDIERNVSAGNCSFCGREKADPKCGHGGTKSTQLDLRGGGGASRASVASHDAGVLADDATRGFATTNDTQPDLNADKKAVSARKARQNAGVSAHDQEEECTHVLDAAAQQLQAEEAQARAREQTWAPFAQGSVQGRDSPTSVESSGDRQNADAAGQPLKKKLGRPRKPRHPDGTIIRGGALESSSAGTSENGGDGDAEMPPRKKRRGKPPKQGQASAGSSMEPSGSAMSIGAASGAKARNVLGSLTAVQQANLISDAVAATSAPSQHGRLGQTPVMSEAPRSVPGGMGFAPTASYSNFHNQLHGQEQNQSRQGLSPMPRAQAPADHRQSGMCTPTSSSRPQSPQLDPRLAPSASIPAKGQKRAASAASTKKPSKSLKARMDILESSVDKLVQNRGLAVPQNPFRAPAQTGDARAAPAVIFNTFVEQNTGRRLSQAVEDAKKAQRLARVQAEIARETATPSPALAVEAGAGGSAGLDGGAMQQDQSRPALASGEGGAERGDADGDVDMTDAEGGAKGSCKYCAFQGVECRHELLKTL